MHSKMSSQPSPTNAIGPRLKAEMVKRGVTSIDLAKRADVKTSFIYDIISGKSANPSTVKLARVADALGINLSLLASGGDTASAPYPHHDEYAIVPRIMVDVSVGKGEVISTEQEAESYYFRKSWIKDRLGANTEDLRMLYIRGDNMEPTLCHNDIVLIDTTKKKPSPPGMFILFDGHGLTAKRLEYVNDSPVLRIISDNPHYSTYERSLDDTLIIGRIVWFAREV